MASPVLYAPLSGYAWDHPVHAEGEAGTTYREEVRSKWTRVMPGFFKTIGDGILAGRPITDADNSDTQPVAVVNQAFARKFYGNRSPIGRRFGPGPQMNAGTYEIVGVAADVRFSPYLGGPVPPMYFVPEAQTTRFVQPNIESREVWSHYPYSIVIWAPDHTGNLQAQVRAALAAVDPGLVVYGMQSYADVIHGAFARSNMIAQLTRLFGALALLLAAIGLYGLTAYGVEQRTSELGVRMALGAERGSVVAMVLVSAFSPVAIGLALGIPAALGAGHLVARQLFGVSPWDAPTLIGASLLLVGTALAAAIVPAMRAARVDPMAALRVE
ncbi:MAG: ABC transporter permease [Gemmatimonadota bacterium]